MSEDNYDPAGDERNDPKRKQGEELETHAAKWNEMKSYLDDTCPHCGEMSALHREDELNDHHYLAGNVTVGNVDQFHKDLTAAKLNDMAEYQNKINNADVSQKFADIVKKEKNAEMLGSCKDGSCESPALNHTLGEWIQHGNPTVFKRKGN